jgi:CHASE2 domain-containing sensor protein
MNRTLKLLGAAAVFALLLVAPPPALAESDCDADVSVSSQRDDPDRSIRRLAFRVEISTTADCAHIHYDLILEIVIPNGQVKKVRKPRVVKLNDGSLSELVEHDIPIDHTLAGYETKLVECKVCEMGT